MSEQNGLPMDGPAELSAQFTPAAPANVTHSSGDLDKLRYDALSANYDALPTFPVRPSYKDYHSNLTLQTQCVVFDGCPKDPHKPASTPIYQTATFVQPSASEFGAYDYSRSGNPTRTALEKQVALLEGAHAAFAFTSGMAALVAVTRLLSSGDELLVGDDIYGGMFRLVTRVSSALHGIIIRFVDTTDLASVAAAISPATRMLHMETPSNPMMRITDIRKLSALLRERGVLLSIDSTMMSPILQRPLQLGADVVVHSATKFFGGHSDVMGGLVCLRTEELAKKIAFFQNAEGTGLEPFACWLFIRGIKTLALRVDKAQANARIVAQFLEGHPLVKKLNYAGLAPAPDDKQAIREYRIHESQANGPGCVMSFTTGSAALSRRFIDALRIFKLTVSFGSVNSLCEMPCLLSHASIPAADRKLPEDLIRLSVGIENVSDLTHDIEQAFDLAGNAHVSDVRAVRRRGSSVGESAADKSTAAATAAAAGASSSDSANAHDAALVARAEVARLQSVVSVLRERLVEVETKSAAIEAARRSALRSTGQQTQQQQRARSSVDGDGTGGTDNGTALGPHGSTGGGGAAVANGPTDASPLTSSSTQAAVVLPLSSIPVLGLAMAGCCVGTAALVALLLSRQPQRL